MNASKVTPVDQMPVKISLPLYQDGAFPGPIFSIVFDESGNLYYSDELNHRVVSLDPHGELRWVLGSGQPDFCPFRYPRGISIGWIQLEGEVICSLAVCDSWHNRLVFINLEGKFIAEWLKAGELSFNEISDVRFISNQEIRNGYWVISDRGNHRICQLDMNGKLLSTTGKPFPSSLVTQWRTPQSESGQSGQDIIPTLIPFDPLYYPMRIFGNSEDALFIWENPSNGLKQIFAGNLFPLNIGNHGNHWISADESGFIGWHPESSVTCKYNSEGSPIGQLSIEETPVPSPDSVELFWLQSKNGISPFRIAPMKVQSPGSHPFSLLCRTAEDKIEHYNLDDSKETFRLLKDYCESYIDLADETLELHRKGKTSKSAIQRLLDKLNALRIDFTRIISGSSNDLFDYVLGNTILSLLADRGIPLPDLSIEARAVMKDIVHPLIGIFPRLAVCADDLYIAYLSLQTIPADNECRKLESLIESLHYDINKLVHRIYDCKEALSYDKISGKKTIGTNTISNISSLNKPVLNINRISRETSSPVRYKETDRISLQIAGHPLPKPYGIAQSPEGNLYLSLFNAGTIIQFNWKERFPNTPTLLPSLSGPLGIAFDPKSRLWIVDKLKNTIIVWDPSNGNSETISSFQTGNIHFSEPVGICRTAAGSMMMADTGSHRILNLFDNKDCRIFSSGEGTEPGKFRLPNFLCCDRSDGGYWIVDHRNHRIQHFDEDGNFINQIGKCGLGPGELYLPASVALFGDGMLAVSQGHLNRCLKLFTPDGEESGHLKLDYAPGGMLAWEDKLLVTQFDGDSLYVYERT